MISMCPTGLSDLGCKIFVHLRLENLGLSVDFEYSLIVCTKIRGHNKTIICKTEN